MSHAAVYDLVGRLRRRFLPDQPVRRNLANAHPVLADEVRPVATAATYDAHDPAVRRDKSHQGQ